MAPAGRTTRTDRASWQRIAQRLVVVPDQEYAVLRRGQQQGQPELAAVHVPRLVDRKMVERRTASRSSNGSTRSPPSVRISRPRAWNVLTQTLPAARPSGSSAASTRDAISSAARLLNVTAVMAVGLAPVATSHAIRATRVVVLPLPAGATHSTGPGGAVAAARWSGASRARRSATEEGGSTREGCQTPLTRPLSGAAAP